MHANRAFLWKDHFEEKQNLNFGFVCVWLCVVVRLRFFSSFNITVSASSIVVG